MKHISKMTEKQMNELANEVQEAAINWTDQKGFSGLSEVGRFDFYVALQKAIENEWLKAKNK